MSRLADEAMYFGAVADGVESQQEEIAELRQQLADRDEQISDLTISSDTYFAERNSARDVWRRASKDRDELRQQVSAKDAEIARIKADKEGLVCGDCDGSGWLENREDGRYPCTCMTEAEPYQILQEQLDTAWAQAHRLALELECLIMDTKDNAVVSKWWDSAFEAIEEYNKLKPGAAEDAEAWAKMRKAGI